MPKNDIRSLYEGLCGARVTGPFNVQQYLVALASPDDDHLPTFKNDMTRISMNQQVPKLIFPFLIALSAKL